MSESEKNHTPENSSNLNEAIHKPEYRSDLLVSRSLSVITWLLRIIVGAVFVYSGFVKAIDPWGTIYKFEEYLAAMGLPGFQALTVLAIFLLCATEFAIGISFLFGCYRRSNPVLALTFMCVMTPLTLWIALENPVSDCGCFGDAFILTNWQTFWKNIVLTLAIIWLIKFNKRSVSLISPAFQWLSAIVSALFVVIIAFAGYFIQPLIDFRAYPAGTPLISETDLEEDASDPQFIFVYEKNGEKREFGVDDELPSEEDGWTFIERKSVDNTTHRASMADERSLRLYSEDGEDDLTDEAIDTEGKQLILLMPQLAAVSPASTWKINSLYDKAERQQMDMIALVSGSPEEISVWKDLSMPRYDIYSGDDTAIKEVARGNPAVVFLDNDTVKWKVNLNALDDEYFANNHQSVADYQFNAKNFLRNCLLLYIAAMALLVAFSMIPRLSAMFSLEHKENEEHKENKEE